MGQVKVRVSSGWSISFPQSRYRPSPMDQDVLRPSSLLGTIKLTPEGENVGQTAALSLEPYIDKVILWTNGLVMVFDQHGAQMPKFQGPYSSVVNLILDSGFNRPWELGDMFPGGKEAAQLGYFYAVRRPEHNG